MQDEARLLDMLRAAQKARAFVVDMDRKGFDDDERTQFAVARAIEILGEAATNVDDATRTAHPEIPWQELAGTRIILAHKYFSVDLDVVWSIVHDDLPTLIQSLEDIVPPEGAA